LPPNDERITRVEERLRAFAKASADRDAELRALIEGPPFERSLRGRLHAVEATEASAKLALESLREAQAERAEAGKDRVRAGRRRRGEAWKLIAAITAAAAVVAPYLDRWL
jgi:anti-sigma-K factor RskA